MLSHEFRLNLLDITAKSFEDLDVKEAVDEVNLIPVVNLEKSAPYKGIFLLDNDEVQKGFGKVFASAIENDRISINLPLWSTMTMLMRPLLVSFASVDDDLRDVELPRITLLVENETKWKDIMKVSPLIIVKTLRFYAKGFFMIFKNLI